MLRKPLRFSEKIAGRTFSSSVRRGVMAAIPRGNGTRYLGSQVGQAALGQFAVFGLERPAKLLIAPFQQRVVPPTLFQPIETLCHPMKHQLTSRFSPSQGCVFHARELTVTTSKLMER